MKMIFVLAFALTSSAFACSGEAQLFPSKIIKLEKTAESCKVFINASGSNIVDNPTCYLSGDINAGIEVGFKKDGSCRLDVGQNISGIIVDTDKSVALESSLKK